MQNKPKQGPIKIQNQNDDKRVEINNLSTMK